MDEVPPTSEDFIAEGESNVKGEIEEKPEDAIPDLPENQAAREFLRTAPSKGLFMPLGKEVKVMQCWRCKAYGHRTGDAECPLRLSGNLSLESRRVTREDPMIAFVSERERNRRLKYERVEQLKLLVEEVREEERQRKRRKRERQEEKQRRSNKKNRTEQNIEHHHRAA
eukprot:gene11154-12433_t